MDRPKWIAFYRQKNSVRRLRTAFARRCGYSLILTIVCIGYIQLARSTVYADSPGVCDFGRDEVVLHKTNNADSFDGVHKALFWTYGKDGREQLEIDEIMNDSINTFLAEHPSWQLNAGLSWFIGIPVYQRKIDTFEAQQNTLEV